MKIITLLIVLCLLFFPLGCKDNEPSFGCIDKKSETPDKKKDSIIEPIEMDKAFKMGVTATKDGISIAIENTRFRDPITRTVTLGWDANTETDLAGYKLYYGYTPRPPEVSSPNESTYTSMVPIPEPESVSYNIDLPIGEYYFALTAYDLSNNESNFSNEVTASIVEYYYPLTPELPIVTPII